MQKKWTKEEDEILCTFCVQQYVKTSSCLSVECVISQCLSKKEFEGRSEGSIRMRIQNIKAVLEQNHIKNTIPIKPLSNFAEQTETTLLKILMN